VRRSIGQASAVPLALANGNATISMRAGRRRRFESAAKMAGFAARKPGPGTMRNEPKTGLSKRGLAGSRGAAGCSPNKGLLNHSIVDGGPFGGSRASGKSNGWRER
jgi:hypothetical protein